MSDALAINTKWSVRDFHSHLELRGDVGQYIRFENVGELLECMDWIEKHFGHVREQRPTKHAPDVVESAASISISNASEVSASEADSTPATTQVM